MVEKMKNDRDGVKQTKLDQTQWNRSIPYQYGEDREKGLDANGQIVIINLFDEESCIDKTRSIEGKEEGTTTAGGEKLTKITEVGTSRL